MKKLTSILALAMGASLVSGVAMAASGAPDGYWSKKSTIGGDGSTTTGVTMFCVMTNQDTTIGLSNGVTAAYQCAEASNQILVAACHEGGSRSSPVTCSSFDHDNDVSTPEKIIGEGCTDAMVTAGAKATTPSYMAFGGTSAGGAMKEIPLGGRCKTDGTTLSAVQNWWQ